MKKVSNIDAGFSNSIDRLLHWQSGKYMRQLDNAFENYSSRINSDGSRCVCNGNYNGIIKITESDDTKIYEFRGKPRYRYLHFLVKEDSAPDCIKIVDGEEFVLLPQDGQVGKARIMRRRGIWDIDFNVNNNGDISIIKRKNHRFNFTAPDRTLGRLVQCLSRQYSRVINR